MKLTASAASEMWNTEYPTRRGGQIAAPEPASIRIGIVAETRVCPDPA